MSIIYSAIAIGATIAVYVCIHKGEELVASFLFTLAVWAWGKADYHRLKDKMEDGDGDG